MNHAFSAESRLSHDHTLQLDRMLQSFFRDLDAMVGKDRYVVVLTADQGGGARVTIFSVYNVGARVRGNYLGIEVNTSRSSRTLVISTVDPYFTIDGISRAFDIYYRTNKPINSRGEQYQLVTPGVSVRFGVPFSEYDTVFFGIGAERTEIKGTNAMPNNLYLYRLQFGAVSNSFPISIGWTRDERDSALVPSVGRYQRIGSELALVGDARYARVNMQMQEYLPLGRGFTLALNGELGLGKGLSGRMFPVFKNFYSGGLGSVRGFEQGTLGPHDVTGALIGGAKKVTLNAELIAPVPGAGNDKSLRLYGFMDVGNVFGENEKFSASELRASVGLGISWISAASSTYIRTMIAAPRPATSQSMCRAARRPASARRVWR